MPGFIGPQLATLKMKAASGSQWIHEIKYDGYRVQFRIDGDDRRAYTRNGYNWVSNFSRIASGLDFGRHHGRRTEAHQVCEKEAPAHAARGNRRLRRRDRRWD